MVQVQFDPAEERMVRRLAEEQNVSESLLIHEIVMRWLEDRSDYAAGMRALSRMQYTISLEEMERRAELAG